MQLLIILALLLYGGRSDAQNVLAEVKPVLESIGGDEMKQALKSAEEISSVLSAVQELSGNKPAAHTVDGNAAEPAFTAQKEQSPAISFPLEPISAVADKDITYSLSKYISGN